MTDINKILSFLDTAEKLKTTLRWAELPKGRAESTADHSWRLALMVFLLADELKLDLDVNHAIMIALVHDLAEAVTGDYDAWRLSTGVHSQTKKDEQETAAMAEMRAKLPKNSGEEIYDLWEEYNAAETPEARFVKALDKIEALVHFTTGDYHTPAKNVEFIATYADKAVAKFPELTETLREVKKALKASYIERGCIWKDEYDW